MITQVSCPITPACGEIAAVNWSATWLVASVPLVADEPVVPLAPEVEEEDDAEPLEPVEEPADLILIFERGGVIPCPRSSEKRLMTARARVARSIASRPSAACRSSTCMAT